MGSTKAEGTGRATRSKSIAVSDRGIWESLLTEAAIAFKAPDTKVLCLGRPGIGKRSLIQALHQYACPLAANTEAAIKSESEHSRAVGLEFAHLGARDPELEEARAGQDFHCSAACSVLILEDPVFEKLLLSRLKADDLSRCAALICLDLKTPCTMMEDLRTWLDVLKRVSAELMQQLPLEEQDRLREEVSERVANYEEPKAETSPEATASVSGDGKDAGDDVIMYNLGIPLIVVVTRADTCNVLESAKTLGWSETIEAYLRNECLPFGAGIVYTAVQAKNRRNVEVLYEYLMHRLYGHALKAPPNVPSRDALFVPAGWDSRERVDKTASALQDGLERAFESVVLSLEAAPPAAPPKVVCDDMQEFLKRSEKVLQRMGAVSARSDKAPSPGGPKKAATTELSATGAGKRASIDPKAGIGKGDNASVANFFQNLLTRGQTTGNLEKRASTASTASSKAAPAPKAEAEAAPAPKAEAAAASKATESEVASASKAEAEAPAPAPEAPAPDGG